MNRTILMGSFVKAAAVLLFLGSALAAEEHSNSAPMLGSYFDMIVSGNYESASYFWNRQAQDRSGKFGIQYNDIPLKIDCTSPVVQNLSVMKDFLQPPAKRFEDLFDGKYQKLYYSAIVQGKNIEHIYFAESDGKFYWLTYPQDMYAREWPVKESEFFRVHVHPDVAKYCNGTALSAADSFVRQFCDSLGISQNDVRHLQAVKIDFFYCASEEQVKQMTGRRTRGLYDKASSDIISSFFPHQHEVVHLLVDFYLKQLPLFIHPLFEEGLAVHFGGRWGKSAESLMPLGIYLYNEGLVSLDSLVNYNTFRNSSDADLAYPLAGLFNHFILEKVGPQKYFALYRKLGGSYQSLSALPVDSAKARILGTVSISDWDKFVTAFDEFIKSYKQNHFVALPGNSGKGEEVVSNNSMVIRDNGDWIEFEFTGKDGDEPKGNLLFDQVKEFQSSSSAMFSEQYADQVPFEGYRYGVRFDANEAGLYDYATNCLLAKYIEAVDPSAEYYDPESHKISFIIKKSLTNGAFPTETNYKFLNQ